MRLSSWMGLHLGIFLKVQTRASTTFLRETNKQFLFFETGCPRREICKFPLHNNMGYVETRGEIFEVVNMIHERKTIFRIHLELGACVCVIPIQAVPKEAKKRNIEGDS